MVHPNSLKNLQLGRSGPSSGRELIERVFKLYSKLEIAYTLLRLTRMSALELEEYLLANSRNLPITEELVCRSLLKDKKAGSLYNLNLIWNRLYGMTEFGKGFADEIEELFNSTSNESIKETLNSFRSAVTVLDAEAKKFGEIQSGKIQKRKAYDEEYYQKKTKPKRTKKETW